MIQTTPLSRRTFLGTALVSSALLAGCGSGDDTPKGPTEKSVVIPLVADGEPLRGEPKMLLACALSGGSPKKAKFRYWLMDLTGNPPASIDAATLSVAITNLQSGDDLGAQIERADDGSWSTTDAVSGEAGWWRTVHRVEVDGQKLHGETYFLLPDPNLQGFDAPKDAESDPAAQQALTTALTEMTAWTSLRWWEWLSGGNATIILAQFSVTTPEANGQQDSFENHSLLAGIFEEPEGNATPVPPKQDHYLTVTIGDRGMERTEEGVVQPRNATKYLPIQRYAETYADAKSVQFGAPAEIDGVTYGVLTFHVPTLPTQSEAWYVFFLDQETGAPMQLGMLAMNHYMVWQYFDINQDFVLEFPEATSSATPAP